MTPESVERPLQLLLVEDNIGDVLLMREACSSANMAIQVAVASDGEEALSMLRGDGHHSIHSRPDVILLDLNLPRMDGRQVLKAIKREPTLQSIPVIIMSSSAAEVDMRQSRDLEASLYIVKPSDFSHLREVVASIETFWRTGAIRPDAETMERSRDG
jgi:chemotaxis family two-component system response regulator Rcp1